MLKSFYPVVLTVLSSLLLVHQGYLATRVNLHAGTYQVERDIPFYPEPTRVDTPPWRPDNPFDGPEDPTQQDRNTPFSFDRPGNVTVTFELTEDGKGYWIHERIGGIDIKPPSWISFQDYIRWRQKHSIEDYFKERSLGSNNLQNKSLLPTININSPTFNDLFGGGTVDIKPNGTALLEFSLRHNKNLNPTLNVRSQRNTNFFFDQQIQLNVVGKIGEKMKLTANWNTEASFDFENQFKLEYTGFEDDIIKKIEAGNVSLPLQGSLISGGQNLFGIKVGMQFGPLTVTSIASQQRGKKQEISVTAGAVVTKEQKKGNDYDENRHFFLNHYFRSQYENALTNLPAINSGIQITRMEVWVTNNNSANLNNNRNAVGFIDLAENEVSGTPYTGVIFNDLLVAGSPTVLVADNNANDLYPRLKDPINEPLYREKSTTDASLTGILGLQNGLDFERVENMRKLNETEYTLSPQLGYFSLNSPLQANQVLFVAYQYTLNGKTYQVGEFNQDVPPNANNSNVLFLKMLKPSSQRPTYSDAGEVKLYPTWDLMMKNIYNIGGYGLRPDNFELTITYQSGSAAGDIMYLPTSAVANTPLIQVFGLDRLTNNQSNGSDNRFDFIQGLTINPDKGLIIFPVLEPFGSHLVKKFSGNSEDSATYAFTQLYDLTKADAVNYGINKDRFLIKYQYQSPASNEISLNTISVAPGSVRVTAGGVPLMEGSDYTVNYDIGKVVITNQGVLASGKEIKVSFDSNTQFGGANNQTLIGSRMDLVLNKNLQFGGTIMHMNEQPLIQKVNFGEEPISNVIWGLDGIYKKDSRYITRLIDKLPLLETKEMSNLTSSFEFAHFIPGHPKQIEINGEKGVSYLDYFENTRTTLDLTGAKLWNLSSFPLNNSDFTYGTTADALSQNFTRAHLNWYQIDQIFYQRPEDEFPEADLNNHYYRQVKPTEVFPGITTAAGDNLLRTFDLMYVPTKRGPYNYQYDQNQLNPDGTFKNPTDNWAGIMRRTTTNTDFEQQNYEFIEFWLLDPFIYNPTGSGGTMYLDLGKVSEDVVPDNFRNFENGLPRDLTPEQLSIIDTTAWGWVPITNPPNNNFSNEESARQFQDVGYDGLRDDYERVQFQRILDSLATFLSPDALAEMQTDPSSDNYGFYRSDNFNALTAPLQQRYLEYNGLEGNTPVNSNSNDYSTQYQLDPNNEDLNKNGTLNTVEEYWQYKIDVNPGALTVGTNYIVSSVDAPVDLPNGTREYVKWYQFRIPLASGTAVNNIQNFKSIDFIRMSMTNFSDTAIMRFAKFQIVSTTWRTMRDNLADEGEVGTSEPPDPSTSFEIGTVSITENSGKQPFNYVSPPGIVRQQQIGNTQPGLLQDEQSLVLRVCNLQDGDARGAFKVVNFDLRNYKNLKMFVHAEAPLGGGSNFTNKGDLSLIVRFGSDNTQNYYEYEMPLTPSTYGDNTAEGIWLSDNELNLILDNLETAKGKRNADNFSYQNRYVYTTGLPPGHKITILGVPRTSDIKSMMIGVKNPDDGRGPVCAEVWVNELRVSDFNEMNGYAANARVNLKLADFGTISMTGARMTPGFGSVEKKINQRSREDMTRYDVTGQFSMGKFLPKKWGIEIPLYVSYGEQFITPQFNPLEPDVRSRNFIESFNQEKQRDSVKNVFLNYNRTRSISVNGLRKIRTNNTKKQHIWDIENFSLSYAFNEVYAHDHTTLYRYRRNYTGALNYQFSLQPKNYQPFKGAGKHKNPLSEFNFYLLPKTFSVNINGARSYDENLIRPTANTLAIPPTFFKNFLITRNYNLRWDFTKSLGLTYTASNNARVDEPIGRIDTQEKKDTLWGNFLSFGKDDIYRSPHLINFGRNIGYSQNVQVNYVVPLDKFKWTNFLSSTISYNGSFRWTQAPENNISLGNTIENNGNINATGRLNLLNLYNKSPKLKKLLAPLPPKNNNQNQPPKPEKDSLKVSNNVLIQQLLRILLSVQNIDVNYSLQRGTVLPGYMPGTDNFGLDLGYQDSVNGTSPILPPSLGFIVGSQRDIRGIAGENGWISRDARLANRFRQTYNQQITGRTSITLFRDFKVDFNVTKNTQKSYEELYRYDSTLNGYVSLNPVEMGSHSISYIFINSALEPNKDKSKYFDEFANNRRIISARLGQDNPTVLGLTTPITDDQYYNGYYKNSQDVLLPAFLSAYSIAKPEKVSLKTLPPLPLPNWNVNYTGLSRLPGLNKIFNTITVKHSYRGTYTIGSFMNNLNYRDYNGDGLPDSVIYANALGISGDSIYNFQQRYIVNGAGITDGFSPLLGLQFAWKNGLSAGIDYKTNRSLALSVGNLQMNERRDKDISLNITFRKDKLNKTIRLFGNTYDLKNALNIRLETTLRDTRTRNRTLDSKIVPDYTQGNRTIILKPSIDYVLNNRLNVQLFMEKNINSPYTANSYPSSFTAVGFRVRFTITQ